MSDLLRSLHPEMEAAHLAVVWHGASHRNYDFTSAPGFDYTAERKRIYDRPKPAADAVLAWLTDTPRCAYTCAYDLEISISAARNRLRRLVVQGVAVKRTDQVQHGLIRSIVRYARAK